MQIEKAIYSMCGADNWVRLEDFRRSSRKSFTLLFGVHKSRNGGQVDAWRIECSQVHEARVTDWDLGGVALYPRTHPAAHQFVARQAEVRWSGASNDPLIVGTLYKAHLAAVDDWIDFDTYSRIREMSNNRCACRGPEFLMRVYADALRSLDKQPLMTIRGPAPKVRRIRVLHFGASHVVAERFLAERLADFKP